ncbi:MAG: Gfo/Idh/MocA family protein [Chloroflexota bacterium]
MVVRIGVVGLERGAVLHRALALQPECEVVAVCSRRAETAQRYAGAHGGLRAYDTYAALVHDQDVDAIVVASPAPYHAEQSIAALAAGKHVLSEVPAAWTLEECQRLLAAVEGARGQAVYMFGENANYAAQTCAWEQLVVRGLLGKIVYAESQYIHDLRFMMRDAEGNRTWRADLPPIHYCTHELGPLLRLLAASTGGERDRCVSAIGLHTGRNVAPELGAIDLEVGLFRTASGAVLKVLCAFSIVREPWGHMRTVYGTHGCLESGRPEPGASSGRTLGYFDLLPNLEEMVPLPLAPVRRESPPEAAVPGGHGDSEYWMMRDFVRAVRGEAPPAIDIYDAVEYTAPGICAHLSAEGGGAPVEIPDFRGDQGAAGR